MALSDRPVVAVVGDGASMFAIQALWSAARYRVGALFVVLANGGYAVMDLLADQQGEAAPWPGFGAIDIAAMARAQGCRAKRLESHDELVAALDEAVAQLGERDEPLLLEAIVAPDAVYAPGGGSGLGVP
jgi:benzoylformate decarboxylase